jgi:hypothetical protein
VRERVRTGEAPVPEWRELGVAYGDVHLVGHAGEPLEDPRRVIVAKPGAAVTR